MSEHTFESLSNMKVGQLRETAKEINHTAVDGYTRMKKDELVQALCTALEIEVPVQEEVAEEGKTAIKARIRELKDERDKAEAAHDHEKLKKLRRQIRHHKQKLRKFTV